MALGALARELELGGHRPTRRRIDALEAEYERAAAALKELAPCAERGARACWSPTTTRSTACCWRAAWNCRATRVALRRERPRRARDAARASPSTCCCSTSRCRRWTAIQVLEQLKSDLAAARPAGDRHVVGRGPGQRRALHRAGRRGLPAQAGEPGAAEGAHRREPGEEAPARPAEGTGAALRDVARWPHDLDASGFALGGQRVHGHGDVLRHPRLHLDGRAAAAGGDDRAAEHLLHADVRRHQRPGRRGQPDGRRRPDGDLRRAAAAGRPVRQRGARGAGDDRADRAVQPRARRGAASRRSASASASPRAT